MDLSQLEINLRRWILPRVNKFVSKCIIRSTNTVKFFTNIKTMVEFNFFRQFTLKNRIFSGFYDVLCPKDIQDNSLLLPEISLNDIVQFSFNF